MPTSIFYPPENQTSLKSVYVKEFRENYPGLVNQIKELEEEKRKILWLMIEIGQGHVLQGLSNALKINELAEKLLRMDAFYASLGGIVGYQSYIKSMLLGEKGTSIEEIEPPLPLDLRVDDPNTTKLTIEGIRGQREVCEIVTCGGAADRLGLSNHGQKYPAACFEFLGFTLLERVFRDLLAREYLHQRLFGVKIETPVVLMTSGQNQNRKMIEELLEEKEWFGRSKDSIYIIEQPSVPMFDSTGKWSVDENKELIMRPGGHGVLWHLMDESGVFESLKSKGIKKGIVRQINNPAAGIDRTLVTLIGKGFCDDQAFGFTSCPRIVGVKEGVNVVKVYKDENGHEKRILSNVEYCDFEMLKKVDGKKPFTANTNTLFVDLEAAQQAQKMHPFPGLLLNFKKKCTRLESTMQNIADSIQMQSTKGVFLLLEDRLKTLSAIKKQGKGRSLEKETPQKTVNDLMEEARSLLIQCGASLEEGVIFTYHPALGPLYHIIKQKVVEGKFLAGAELNLEISDVYLKNLTLESNLNITSQDVLNAQCLFENVHVKNDVTISMGKGSILIAENIVIDEPLDLIVPDHMCVCLRQAESGLETHSSSFEACNQDLFSYEIVDGQIDLKIKIPVKQ